MKDIYYNFRMVTILNEKNHCGWQLQELQRSLQPLKLPFLATIAEVVVCFVNGRCHFDDT